MSSRREFLKQTGAALAAATSLQLACSTKNDATIDSSNGASNGTHAMGVRIKSVTRREETTRRLGGNGDNFHMSWAADDVQYVSLCDGAGFLDDSQGFYNSRLFALSGGPQDATFSDVSGYPDLRPEPDAARYYNFGTLALDGHIYQFLSTFNHPSARPDGSTWPDLRFIGAKLIYSPDNGRTWHNQDGSTPVVWESWQQRSRKSLVFFEEPQDAFSLLTVLQMGKNYEANRDGFVYVYAPNGNTEGTMNELVMFRVPKAALLNRSAYEYFGGSQPNGNATWVKDINARSVVQTFPRGWVNTTAHPYAWHPSVVYNAPLALYMMANWGMGTAPDGEWFGKPSYLGFWTAPNPWGPWTQIHEETSWTPDKDAASRAYQPQIAPKWIAEDGKSFWLVWTDFQKKDDKGELQQLMEEYKRRRARKQANTREDDLRTAAVMRRTMPYYSFNIQRVDLVMT
jgi:hypothetical protein